MDTCKITLVEVIFLYSSILHKQVTLAIKEKYVSKTWSGQSVGVIFGPTFLSV